MPDIDRAYKMEEEKPILIGVIGGSGLYHLDNLTFVRQVNPETPWGFPSAPITISSLPSGSLVAFVARHGSGHTIPPSRVPARANIAALKSLGVRIILAFSAVGSLREEIAPGAFALPAQVIDRTKGIRPASFFDDTSIVAHAAFGDPFSNRLVTWLEHRIRSVLQSDEVRASAGGEDVQLFAGKTIVCMEGPQFSTRAESLMYRQWGGDLINMSVLPEAKLAREAELSYALIATATDYDSWRPHSNSVTTADVLATLSTNANISRIVAARIIGELYQAIDLKGTATTRTNGLNGNGHSTTNGNGHSATNGNTNGHSATNGYGQAKEKEGRLLLQEEVGGMKFSIMPRSAKQSDEDRKKLAYILPEYFSD